MEILIGVVCLGVLAAILIRLYKSTDQIKTLEWRLGQLENKFRESRQPERSEPVIEPDLTQPSETAIPVSEAMDPPAQDFVISGPAPAEPPPPSVPEVADTASPPIGEPASRPKPAVWGHKAIGFLRSIGLWPPERKDRSSELVLMQWWAPRLGGVLAILAIIFFAVYVGQNLAPWVRFLEMVAVSFGVFGLGLYIAKKLPGLGNVLVATGLSMVYVSSVAGYAVGPVKVVENPIVAALMQLAALVLNFGMGSWKRDRGILILAVIFGYISSLFAALEGFREAALISALLVYMAGLISYRRIGGLTLVSLSVVGAYLPLAGFLGIEWVKDAAVYPAFWSVIVFLILTVSLLPGIKVFLVGPGFLLPKWNRLYQALNTSLAIGLGFLFVDHFYPLEKTGFYGVLALVFVAWSLIWFLRNNQGLEFHLFFLKGSVLASLWFINYFHGDLRWMALGLQVLILVSSVHRLKSIWLEILTVLTWLVSFGYFLGTGFHEPEFSFLWMIQGLYILVSVGGLGCLMSAISGRDLWRKSVYAVLALLLFGTGLGFTATSTLGNLDEAASMALMALAILLISLVPRVKAWIPVIAGGLLFATSNIRFWFEPSGAHTLLVVLSVAAVCLVGLLKLKISRQNLFETIIHGLWVMTVLVYFRSFGTHPWYPFAIAVFAMSLFFAGHSPLKRIAEWSPLPLLYLFFDLSSTEYPATALFAFLIVVGALANLGVVFPQLKSLTHYLRRRDSMWWILNALFLIASSWVFSATVSLANQILLWIALGLIYYALWYWRSMWVSFVVAVLCALIPVILILELWLNLSLGAGFDDAPRAGQILLAGLCAMTSWLIMGGYSQIRPHSKLIGQGNMLLAWVSGFVAYLVFAATFAYPFLNWERLYTPCLTAFSIGLLILGIVLKSRPYRFVALISFAVPLFRLIVFDIRETLFRIIAFAVLAVVLTLAGFLYQRFSSRIE